MHIYIMSEHSKGVWKRRCPLRIGIYNTIILVFQLKIHDKSVTSILDLSRMCILVVKQEYLSYLYICIEYIFIKFFVTVVPDNYYYSAYIKNNRIFRIEYVF
jgi:hypothetical protein